MPKIQGGVENIVGFSLFLVSYQELVEHGAKGLFDDKPAETTEQKDFRGRSKIQLRRKTYL